MARQVIFGVTQIGMKGGEYTTFFKTREGAEKCLEKRASQYRQRSSTPDHIQEIIVHDDYPTAPKDEDRVWADGEDLEADYIG